MLDTAERLAGVYRGIVADRDDPEGLLRVRVRVTSLLGDQETDWAWPSVPALGGAQAPNAGDPVWIIFEEGDIDRPVYLGTWAPNQTPAMPVSTEPYIISGGTNVYATTTAIAYATEITGDTGPRMTLAGDGTLRWGGGLGATDTALGRTGPAALGLTGSLTVSSAVNAASLALSTPLPISSGGTGSTTRNFVDLTTAQNVGGVKTFTSAPIVPANSFPESAVTNLVTDLATKATDSLVVHLAGTETITGAKTFTTLVTAMPATAGNVALRADGLVGQTADLFQARVNGTNVFMVGAGGLATITGGITLSGSSSGYAGGEITFVGAAPTDTAPSIGTDAAMMYFDHRRSGNTGGWAWRNAANASIIMMSLSGTGILSLTAAPGTTHDSNRVDGAAQHYGRGFAYAADGRSFLGGVTAGLSISVGRTDPAASINNAATGDILQLWNTSSFERWAFRYDGVMDMSLAAITAEQRKWAVKLPYGSSLAAVGGTYYTVRWGQMQDGVLYHTVNAYYDGTNWQRDNTTMGTTGLTTDSSTLRFYYGPAAANPITNFTEKIRYDAGLNNGSFYVYGNDTFLGRGAFGAAAGRLHMGDLGTNDAYIIAETGTGAAASLHMRAQTAHFFEDASGVARFYIDSSGNLHQNNVATSLYATFAEGVAANAIRIGEIFSDGGLWKATGSMRFDLNDVAGSWKWSYQGTVKTLMDHNGNLNMLAGQITATGGPLIGGVNVVQGGTNPTFTGVFNYTNTAYANVAAGFTNPTFTRTASPNASLLIRIVASGAFNGTAGQWVEIGVRIGATDYTIIHFYFNQASTHATMAGENRITLAGTGSTTITPRIRVSGGTFTFDTNDVFFITITEA